MRAWWIVSAVLVTLLLAVLVLAVGAMPLALRGTLVAVLVVLWTTALLYFAVGRR